MSNGRILVTGGAGFIGSHTCVALLQNNYEVIIIDDLSNSHIDVIDRITEIAGTQPIFEKFNILDNDKLVDCFRRHAQIHAVIHFAAYKAVGESVQKPLTYYQNNIGGLISLLSAMQEADCNSLVFSSSCTVYGQPDNLPVDEQTPTKRPESPYGNTKKIAEEILQEVCAASSLNTISLRYFNPIGAHPSAKIGELPIGTPNNLIPILVQAAAGVRGPLTIHGDDYPTADGTAVRDYIYVMDLAQAHVKALERLMGSKNGQSFETFNVGTGNGFSVREIINAFEKATKVSVPYSIGPRREGDITEIYANCTLANTVLNWRAETSLENMLLSAWNWQKTLK